MAVNEDLDLVSAAMLVRTSIKETSTVWRSALDALRARARVHRDAADRLDQLVSYLEDQLMQLAPKERAGDHNV